jgi:Tol biopolymer transport system component
MALLPGTKLGPYEIQSPLGAGGMGEVYRARDTRLDRTVAVKILPSHLSDSQEAQQRFDREARAISSLSHPNICHLYDVGAHAGTTYLVMEFLDGESLADRLLKGPLPVEQALKYGIEICEGLEKAHRSGVVHRDLKPGNIMLTKSGAKLMDFGLAKPLLAATTPSSDLTQTLVTPRQPLTTEGTLVGTFQYMSPEQVEGKEADARSDIFSLGALLHEMVTGKPAFEGKTIASTIAAILASDPPAMSALQPSSSPALDATVKSCLAKDPDERLQSAHDVKLQLKWLPKAAGSGPIVSESPPRRWHWWLVAGLSAICVLLAAALVWRVWRASPAAEQPVTRFTIALARNQELATDATQAVALSSDGVRLAYVAAENSISRLYIHRLDQFSAVEIPDSEGATFPFFSPTGEWVAFFSQGKLKKAPADGGQPAVVCDIQTFFGGTWLPNDTIIVAVPNYGLASVPASGGSLQKVPINAKDAFYPQGPAWLPGGEWLMFRDYFSAKRTLVVNLQTGEMRQIGKNVEALIYAEGHLIFYNNGALWSAPFDLGKIAITGSPMELERGVTERNYVGQGTASENGVLAYAPGAIGNFSRNIYAVSRNGQEQKINVPAQDFVDPAVSPDGRRLVIVIRRINEQQIAVYDRDRDVMTVVVPNGAINASPAWTPDGKRLLFDSSTAQKRGIYQVAADGGSAPALLRETSVNTHVTAIAGNNAALMVNDPSTSNDLWLMSFDAQHSIQPFKRTSAAERQGTLSPDGRWMAYVSNESGRSEIYVEPVPGPGGRWQISNDGGEQPRWVRNGKEIVYRNGNKMMSVPVGMQPVFQAGRSVELFEGKFDRGGAVGGYDVTPDGKTFFMTRSEQANPTEIRVVTGLQFDKRAPK